MSTAFNNFEALERALQYEVRSRLSNVKNDVDTELYNNVLDYYSVGNPGLYERTGTLTTSPQSSPIMGAGNHLEFEAKMNNGISYPDGNYTGEDVIEATEEGWSSAGVLGKTGYFKKTEESVPRIVDKYFS